MRKITVLLIAMLMTTTVYAAVFTDSLGRSAELSDKIERIVPSMRY